MSLSLLTLLYIEDDIDIQSIYTAQLESLVDNIICAKDGQEGYECYLRHKPNIILLDINMPKLDGISLAKKIREVDNKVKIIITSSYADQDKLLEAIELSLVKYILKPIDPKVLEQTIIKAKNEIEQEEKKEDKKIFLLDKNITWNATDKKLFSLKEEIKLTKNERRLLTLISTSPNRVYTFFEIFDYLSADDFYKEYNANQIRALVKLLRKKIPKNSILNVYGEGYRFNPVC
ncbi:Putative two-component response regulator [hydrothermal vent metagenome]|uniref:Putative two-component response regulator n=1 Tax=hydrothermal vent metagenome TaxID=652676 RepID=A0A1W1BWG8_9ZZZZ